MILDGNILRASEGKVLKRKGTDEIFGSEIALGYSYYIEGVLQEPPHLDTEDDFEEVEGFYGDTDEVTDAEALAIITGQYDETE